MRTYHDLDAFQSALDLVVLIYRVTSRLPREELYGLTSQMRRAAISVMSNIAEGQGRLSLGEWRQFLGHSRGSLYEIEAQAMAAVRLGFITTDEHAEVQSRIDMTGSFLAGLIRYVKKRERTESRRNAPSNPATSNPKT